MTWQRSSRQFLALDAAEVWSVVADVRRWPQWCRAIGGADMDLPAGALATSGATGRYVPAAGWAGALHSRTAPPLRVVEVVDGRRLVIEQPNPTGVMRVEWDVEPSHSPGDGAGCVFHQRVTSSGPLTPAVVLGAAGPIAAGFAEDVARLHALVRPPAPATSVAPESSGTPRTKVVIAGGTGSLGRALASDLTCRGHEVVLLTRSPRADLPYRQVIWDGEHQGAWTAELAEPERTSLINLAGELVDARPTPENIARLRGSRVAPTRALVTASRALDRPLRHWVQGSTTAIWSDAGDVRLVESSPLPVGSAALPQMTGIAQPWEEASDGANTDHLVLLRTSIVLQQGNPALVRLSQLTRAGLGGRVGSGQQWFSWIHIDDWLRIVRGCLGVEPDLPVPGGVLVAASDVPVRNRDLMASLRRHLRRPPAPPTPDVLLRVGAVVLRSDPALGLTGRHCTLQVLDGLGFTFMYPTIDDALDDLLT
ncbi:NAD-dependent epimerase/dehydratase family protein [Janibacter sp. G1551]|uniref:NAD-dependent epimerase/dehydratase family protein n=1 Tax=Janibacter sp. G1551 TaxID=3420440 RepID=UPI003D00E006